MGHCKIEDVIQTNRMTFSSLPAAVSARPIVIHDMFIADDVAVELLAAIGSHMKTPTCSAGGDMQI